ncbi:hypothetical protein JCM33374_g1511 [Metschnikowia sp. JCM 33374]|nr:hypothetical protein JCM33374_g1511 [Metschnikowia sp. JCM 33374]
MSDQTEHYVSLELDESNSDVPGPDIDSDNEDDVLTTSASPEAVARFIRIMAPRIRWFIENLEYPEVFIGNSKTGIITHYKVAKKGMLNEKQKRLFKYINIVLNSTPCITFRMMNYAKGTESKYKTQIIRYILFIANKPEFDVENFKIDGFLVVECIKHHIDKVPTSAHGILVYRYAMTFLHRCIGAYNASKKIVNVCERAEEIERWNEFPYASQIDDYYKIINKEVHLLMSSTVPDKRRSSMFQKKYTIEDIERMVKNMHVKTSTGRISHIYVAINSILEFFLGHHLLFRTQNKVALELSDSVYDEFRTSQGNIPILGFQFTIGKTLNEYSRPGISGVCRHKKVLMCLVSAFALSLWYRFDFDDQYGSLTGKHVLNFLDKKHWYKAKVLFSTSKKSKENHLEISSGYSNKLPTTFFESIGFKSAQKGHSGRKTNAENADAFGVKLDQIRRAGRWDLDVLESRYASSFAFEFIHFSAGFKKDEQYYIARDIPVPEELQKMIFPWLEEVREQVENRSKEEKASDGAVSEFSLYAPKVQVNHNSGFGLVGGYCARKKIEFVQYGMDQLNANARNHFDAQAMAIRAQNEQFPDMIAKVTKRQVYDIIHHEYLIMKNGQREIIKCLKNADKRQEDLENRVLEMKEYFEAHFQRISDMIMSKETQQIPDHIQTTSIPPIQTPHESTHESEQPLDEEDGTFRPSKKAKTEDPRFQGTEFDFLLQVKNIPDILKEWYESKPGKPSIAQRDKEYKAAWRTSTTRQSAHKRKKVFISFIRRLQQNLDLRRDEACELLEKFRKDHKLGMCKMRTKLENETEKEEVFKDIKEKCRPGQQ